jgi:hypothetical protein
MITKLHFSIVVTLLSLSVNAQENYSVRELEKLADNSISEYQSLLDSADKKGDMIKDTLDKEWFMMSGSTVYRVVASFAKSKPGWVHYNTYSAIASKGYARTLASEAIDLGYKPVSNDTTTKGSQRDIVQHLSSNGYDLIILEKQSGSTDNAGNFRLTPRSYSEFAVIVQRKK